MFNPASYRNRLENGNMNTDTRALGIDIGSTTTKLVFIENEKIIYEKYRRHHSKVQETTLEMLREARPYLAAAPFAAAISGSAGMGIAERADIEFVQEVYATGEVVRELSPETGLVIELGGEDAKAIFFNVPPRCCRQALSACADDAPAGNPRLTLSQFTTPDQSTARRIVRCPCSASWLLNAVEANWRSGGRRSGRARGVQTLLEARSGTFCT